MAGWRSACSAGSWPVRSRSRSSPRATRPWLSATHIRKPPCTCWSCPAPMPPMWGRSPTRSRQRLPSWSGWPDRSPPTPGTTAIEWCSTPVKAPARRCSTPTCTSWPAGPSRGHPADRTHRDRGRRRRPRQSVGCEAVGALTMGSLMTESQQRDQPPGTRHTVVVPGSIDMVRLLGPGDDHLALIERSFDLRVHVRGNRITLDGERGEVALAERLLDEMVTMIRSGQGITTETVERVLSMLRAETSERPADVLSLNILSNRGRSIRPKTLNQKRYVDSIDKHTITFGIGPAGTGKTYLAMAKAVQALQSKSVNRIILSRPAVEAGERLGFLPGTLTEKIDPYLRPLYDALHDMVDPESI